MDVKKKYIMKKINKIYNIKIFVVIFVIKILYIKII